MRIGVGSLNRVKIKAVEDCFREFFGEEVVVEAFPVDVPPQPIGFKEALRGAVIRAVRALEEAGADYGVGLEAGLIEKPYSITGYVDQHICAIVDSEKRVTLGYSMAFEFPVIVVDKLVRREAREAEEVMEEISGIKDIGCGKGAIGYLTKGAMERIILCKQAVISALIPRINPRLYSRKWPRIDEILREI